jgi:sortase A
MNQKPWNRRGLSRLRIASWVLIAVGLVLLSVAVLPAAYRRWEEQRVQQTLSQTAPTGTPKPPTLWPTFTPSPVAPSPTATPTLEAAEPAEVATTSPEPSPLASPTSAPSSTPTRTAVPAPTSTLTPPTIVPSLPVRIQLPDLQIDALVTELGWEVQEVNGALSSVWRMEDIADGKAGHLVNTALPGEADNVVIAGHHNIEGNVFKSISLAWSDDAAEIEQEGIRWRSDVLSGRSVILHDAEGRQHTYTIESTYKLADRDVSEAQRLENAGFMAPTTEATLTLITCWPYNTNTHRIIVVARLDM